MHEEITFLELCFFHKYRFFYQKKKQNFFLNNRGSILHQLSVKNPICFFFIISLFIAEVAFSGEYYPTKPNQNFQIG